MAQKKADILCGGRKDIFTPQIIAIAKAKKKAQHKSKTKK